MFDFDEVKSCSRSEANTFRCLAAAAAKRTPSGVSLQPQRSEHLQVSRCSAFPS